MGKRGLEEGDAQDGRRWRRRGMPRMGDDGGGGGCPGWETMEEDGTEPPPS